MKLLRQHKYALLFVVLSFAVVLALYGKMPDPVPTHWNARGEVDGWMAKPWGALLTPLVSAGVTALLVALPRLAPKETSLDRFARVYGVIVAAIAAFLLLVTSLTSLYAVGVHVAMTNAICAGAGALFAVLGNFFGKVTRNFFVGIRTPWTLSNDEVWLRTHRLGGKLFVGAGLVTVAASLLGHGLAALLAGAAIAAIVPAAYSYVVYRRIVGR
ncbi:MAG TPA: SdpI family protein [Minicystis sp.]|nr:SdpI family protein [Minicystis sp.]